MINWITGKAHIGKSTYIDYMVRNFGGKALYIGRQLRAKYGERSFINSDNPS